MKASRKQIRNANQAAREFMTRIEALLDQAASGGAQGEIDCKPISARRAAELERMVRAVADHFHFRCAAQHAIFRSIREKYTLRSVRELPVCHFDEVVDFLSAMQAHSMRYMLDRAARDKDFIKRVLSVSHPPAP